MLACEDCGLPYKDFPLDVAIPNGQWNQIHPEDGGILCANCMVARAAKLMPGVTVAHMIFEVTSWRLEMPTPGKNEKQKDFIGRCIPIVMKEGTAKDSKQASAICHSIWRRSKGEKDEPPKKDAGEIETRRAAAEAELDQLAAEWFSGELLRNVYRSDAGGQCDEEHQEDGG